MSTHREQMLAAIALRLETVAGLTVRRNEALPEKIPTGGLAILRDGDPGDPEVVLSPLTYLWRHAAPVEIVVQHGDAAERDRRSDELAEAVTAALLTDRNLGGLADWLEASPPSADLLARSNADGSCLEQQPAQCATPVAAKSASHTSLWIRFSVFKS